MYLIIILLVIFAAESHSVQAPDIQPQNPTNFPFEWDEEIYPTKQAPLRVIRNSTNYYFVEDVVVTQLIYAVHERLWAASYGEKTSSAYDNYLRSTNYIRNKRQIVIDLKSDILSILNEERFFDLTDIKMEFLQDPLNIFTVSSILTATSLPTNFFAYTPIRNLLGNQSQYIELQDRDYGFDGLWRIVDKLKYTYVDDQAEDGSEGFFRPYLFGFGNNVFYEPCGCWNPVIVEEKQFAQPVGNAEVAIMEQELPCPPLFTESGLGTEGLEECGPPEPPEEPCVPAFYRIDPLESVQGAQSLTWAAVVAVGSSPEGGDQFTAQTTISKDIYGYGIVLPTNNLQKVDLLNRNIVAFGGMFAKRNELYVDDEHELITLNTIFKGPNLKGDYGDKILIDQKSAQTIYFSPFCDSERDFYSYAGGSLDSCSEEALTATQNARNYIGIYGTFFPGGTADQPYLNGCPPFSSQAVPLGGYIKNDQRFARYAVKWPFTHQSKE